MLEVEDKTYMSVLFPPGDFCHVAAEYHHVYPRITFLPTRSLTLATWVEHFTGLER